MAAKLQLIGSSRGHGDDARVEELRKACQLLGLADHVEFCINVPYLQLQQLLGAAVGGLHTMVDEHFGISVVEYMAAGMQLCHSVYMADALIFLPMQSHWLMPAGAKTGTSDCHQDGRLGSRCLACTGTELMWC